MALDVSVIIPTYNRCGFLKHAIQSCFDGNEALDVEVVVIDDGSTDGTRKFLRSLKDERIQSFFQEHQGAQVARNRGMEEARGAFIKFLDDDDLLIKGALTQEVNALRGSGASISYGDLLIKEADSEEWTFRQGDADDLISGIFDERIWTHPHVFLYRRPVLANAEWDTSIPYEQDKAFAIQVASQGLPTVKLDQTVAIHYRHSGERITTTLKIPSGKERFLRRIELIEKGVQLLRKRELVKNYHTRAAARGMWCWTYMVAAYDLRQFEECYRRIKRIDSEFRPPRKLSLLRILDRIISPVMTEKIVYPARVTKRNLKHALRSLKNGSGYTSLVG